MPRSIVAASLNSVRCGLLTAGSRPPEDAAKNAAEDAACAAPPVVSVVVAAVLPVALVVALHEAVAECLRGGVAEVVRPLRAVALPALRVAGAGAHARLVALVRGDLVGVVVAALIRVYPPARPSFKVLLQNSTIAALRGRRRRCRWRTRTA